MSDSLLALPPGPDSGTARIAARKDGAIGWLIFNNPERRNAVSVEMWRGITQALRAFDADPAIRAVVLAGAGDKAFVSGADISEFDKVRATQEDQAGYKDLANAAQAAIAGLSKPTIAMIKGFCIGGGLAVALSCDLRIAAEGSRFAIPAAKLGVGYPYDGIAALVAMVGPAYAREIMFTGRHFSAEEALRMGLINRKTELAELEKTVREYAAQIAANAPLTLKAAKLAVAECLKDPDARRRADADAATAACFASADYQEGRRAFLEKRPPEFTGK